MTHEVNADPPEPQGSRIPALRLLCNLGWQFLGSHDRLQQCGGTRQVLLIPRLIEVLQTRRFEYKGEWVPLSPSGIDQIVRELSALDLAHGLLRANERLYNKLLLGIAITEFMPDGKRHQPTIAVIDWSEQGTTANRFDVAEGLEVLSAHGTHSLISDIVCYVNGIPLAVIEAQRPGAASARKATGKATVEDGISRHLRNQRHDQAPHLFAYAQLLLAIGHGEARYGTTGTAAKFWARWREEEFSDAQMSAWKNLSLDAGTHAALFTNKPTAARKYFERLWSQPASPTEQDRLLAALLHPARLLEFLRFFVLFDRKAGKVVARYQQFFGTRALIRRVGERRPDGAREGGIVWHTTGSGKSFTMVFLTKALVLHDSLKACRVIVVTDRPALEDQLARNVMSGGALGSATATKKEGERPKVGSGRELARRIGQGTERIIFTPTHKFATASRQPACYNPSADLIVLVDEGRRSHGGRSGEIHERLRKSLPRAACIAFTGTPLLRQEKAAHKFGPIVHAHTMQRAVEDATLTPLLYEERIPELSANEEAVNRWFDRITAGLTDAQGIALRKRFADKRAIHGAATRIELIAWDIASHFHEYIKKPGLGLKGQVATSSKLDAIRYKQFLDETGLVSSAIVISAPDSREGNTEVDESTGPEVRKWWNAHVGHRQDDHERDVLQGFAGEGEPDLLIVVDRLLSGFDEPRNAVLYIDKPLKEHDLMQAIARVNRLHEAKRHGVLVDYRGILKALDTAVPADPDLETRTRSGYDLADIEGIYQPFSSEYRRLPGLHQRLWAIFGEVKMRHDLEQCRQVLMPRYTENDDGQRQDTRRKVREDFHEALTEFASCLHTSLSSHSFFEDHRFSQNDVQACKKDLGFFTNLRHVAGQDAMETTNYSAHESQIRGVVDKQVTALEARETEGVYKVHRLGALEDPGRWSEEKTRNEADMIRTRLMKTVEQDLADDPYAQKVFAELLKQAIAEAEALFDRPLEQHALFKELEETVRHRTVDGMPDVFGENSHARAYFGICRLVLGEADFAAAQPDRWVDEARHIDKVVTDAVAENSLNPQNIEAAIRKALLPRLFALMGLDRAKNTIEQVIQVTRIGLGRGTL